MSLLRYWSEASDSQNFNYPYISLENKESLENESNIVRFQKCEKALIKPKNSNNTILKIFQNCLSRSPRNPFIHFQNSYFGQYNPELSEDLISYCTYTYMEVAELSKTLAILVKLENLYTPSIHNRKKISLMGVECSQKLESIVTFMSAYYNNYTNLLLDERLTGEELFRIISDSAIDNLFCSYNMMVKLMKYITENNKQNRIVLKNVMLFENSNEIDTTTLENFSNIFKTRFLFFWEMIYTGDNKVINSKSPEQFNLLTTPSQTSTPAVIVYKLYSSNNKFINPRGIVINHSALVGKALGYYLFFQNTISSNAMEIFAIAKNISHLDCLCLFIMGMYLNFSVALLSDENNLFCRDIKENILPSIVYLDYSQFLHIYKRIDIICKEKLGCGLERINEKETIRKYEFISTKLLGEALKVMIVYNQNNLSHYQVSRFKLISPIHMVITQGYREETVGSLLASFNNNLISGGFGLLIPCYEAKVRKECEEKIDTVCNTQTGNLIIRGEGLFNGYFKNYIQSPSLQIGYQSQETNWLVTNLKCVLAKNLSMKILDRYEDMVNTYSMKNLNMNFIKSQLLSKYMIGVIDDAEIRPDSQNYELDLIYRVDKKMWGEFFEIFLINYNLENNVSKDQITQLGKSLESSTEVLIYHKYEEYYHDNNQRNVEPSSSTSSSQILLKLRNAIIVHFEKILENNLILSFKDINKIILFG